MQSLRCLVFAVVGIVVVGSATAHAGPIVLESYTEERTEMARKLMQPVLDELARRGFVGGYDAVGRKYEAEISRPALSAGGLPASFAEQVEKGHQAWIAGKFDDAVHTLAPLVDAAHANTGAFAQNQQLRDQLLKALIALALSQQRMGDPSAARTTFGELLRSYPDTQLSRASYGPDAYAVFEQVRKDLGAGGRGKLAVKVDSDSVVFINERFETVGPTTRADLVPGEYRVYAQLGKDVSRSHRVVVRANDDAAVAVDWGFDHVLHTSPDWTGFLFATPADRERLEATYAAELANAFGASAVAIVGVELVHGRAAVVGALINLQTGREIRRASIAIEPAVQVERLRALARFLAGDEATAGLDVQVASEKSPAARTIVGAHGAPDVGAASGSVVTEPASPQDTASGGAWGGWKWVTGAGGVVGLGTGIALIALDGHCSSPAKTGVACPSLYNTDLPGVISLGAGAALAGVSIYLFAHHHHDAPARAAFVVPTERGAMAGFATTF